MYTINLDNTSSNLTPDSHLAVQIQRVQANTATPDSASVIVSGSVTGSFTYNGDLEPKQRFEPDEVVTVTTTDAYIVDYLYVGDQSGYIYADTNRTKVQPNMPWWTKQTTGHNY